MVIEQWVIEQRVIEQWVIEQWVIEQRQSENDGYLDVISGSVDVRIQCLEECLRRDDTSLEHHYGFDDTGWAAGPFEVAYIGFYRAADM